MKIILDKYKFPCDYPACKPLNWWSYIQGKLRYKAYYSKNYKWLIRNHIFEQILWRISIMDKECFSNGACKMCGCDTTALQMANKACPKPCYPKMMNKFEWNIYKINNNLTISL